MGLNLLGKSEIGWDSLQAKKALLGAEPAAREESSGGHFGCALVAFSVICGEKVIIVSPWLLAREVHRR